MNCAEVKPQLLDFQRDRLPAEDARAVRSHLETCASCAQADQAERALTELLETRLPQYPATPALKRRLASLVATNASDRASLFPFAIVRWFAPALVGALVASSAVLLHTRESEHTSQLALFTSEAVNDYLRVLAGQRRVEVEGGGTHQVKPWFEGRLDFAPDVPEIPNLTLRGGSVGYFRDRKAAVIVYTLRLHTVTLLEVQTGGLPWPTDDRQVRSASDRHFNVFFWRGGELGYALVSDAEPGELGAIARELATRR